jgi:CubicO group peptidase (beta-lactamase class C family)
MQDGNDVESGTIRLDRTLADLGIESQGSNVLHTVFTTIRCDRTMKAGRPAVALAFLMVALLVTVPVLRGSAQVPPAGDAARRVDDYLTRLVPYGFSGAVLIARDDVVILKKGYGLANRAARQPYSADMVSSIGSVTKQFTGAAIMKLEMMGRLRTEDPISKYLPGVPGDKAPITIHHLLTHTAGFPGALGGADNEPIERDALVARVLAAPLASKPGERFEYSNEGYSLAGAIVERVSGQGYESFLRDHLFRPAGMLDTGYQLPAWPLERLPLGYGSDGREWGRIFKRGWLPDGPGWYLRANGGIHSTLDDMYRWHRALEGDAVLSREAVAKYQTGHADAPGGERYAYGWGVQKTRRGTTVIAHNGGNGVFFADVRRYVDERVVIIAMSNQPVVPATQLAPRQIESLVFNDGPGVTLPPAGVRVPRADREALAGTYALDGGGTVTVRATESALEAEASDPFLFATTTVTPAGGRHAALEDRTMSLVADAAKGNFRPIHEAFADNRSFEVVESNQRRFWADWREQFGEFVKAETIGTGIAQGDPAVTVRLHFVKGGPTLQFIWGPRRLVGFRTMPGAGPVALVAESPTEWVVYSYRLPEPIRVSFAADGGVRIVRGGVVRQGTR